MKLLLILKLSILTSFSFGQKNDSLYSNHVKLKPPILFEKTDQQCDFLKLCCAKSYVAVIDFYGASDPVSEVLCNTMGVVTIQRLDVGLFKVTISGGFPENTWMYIQSETSLWREIEMQWQPDNALYIQTHQNGALSDIVTQNVSFELRIYD